MAAQLERSLDALGTDYIDPYQFHSGGDAVFENDELWEALAAQPGVGKIRKLGVMAREALAWGCCRASTRPGRGSPTPPTPGRVDTR